MKPGNLFVKSTAFILLMAIFTGCASTTIIQSIPEGAKLYVDGMMVGNTPYTLRDTKITGASTSIRLEAEGYESVNTYIYKDEEINVGAIIGGVFFWVPFLWIMQYRPSYMYEMLPVSSVQKNTDNELSTGIAEKLRELKKLFDEGLLTQEEYDIARKKVIEQGL